MCVVPAAALIALAVVRCAVLDGMRRAYGRTAGV
jgi:hypothetical protein